MAPTTAPWYSVPPKTILAIEHPCLVKNADKAVDMLGGGQAIAEVLEEGNNRTLALRFQPEDPASRTTPSVNNPTSNVLLKITVPRRTGRKRKRGTDGPFLEDNTRLEPRKDAAYLLQSLRDNSTKYEVEPLGQIPSTHVWRSMPDFVYSTQASSFLNNIRSTILPQQYPHLRDFKLPQTYGLTDTEIPPLSVLSTSSLPYNYSYRQNPAVHAIVNPQTGEKSLRHDQDKRSVTINCRWDDMTYPTRPNPDLLPLTDLPKKSKRIYTILEEAFNQRPIWTKRALYNQFPSDISTHQAQQTFPYFCFVMKSGPWKDAFVRFGVDPRTSIKYRKYQTIMNQLDPQKWGPETKSTRRSKASNNPMSHIFTGKGEIPPDGTTWQFCDLEDRDLKTLVDLPDFYLRATCERAYFGWYPNATVSKIRIIHKAKLEDLMENVPPELTTKELEPILALPDDWIPGRTEADDPMTVYMQKGATNRQLRWASTYRSLTRTPEGHKPAQGGTGKGRLTRSKMTARASFLDPNEAATPPRCTEMEASQDVDDNASGAEHEDMEEAEEELDEGDELDEEEDDDNSADDMEVDR